jgi:hypothetical protein
MTSMEVTGSSAVTTRHDREPLVFFRRARGIRNRHNAVTALAFRQVGWPSERLFYPMRFGNEPTVADGAAPPQLSDARHLA